MITDYAGRMDIDDRYRQRKAKGKPGWTGDYKAKMVRIEKVLARYDVPKNGRFLELGCGAGNITLFMAEKGFEAYGIDMSPEAIAWAKEKMRGSSVIVDFCVGNVVDLKLYSDRSFDEEPA